MMEKQIDEVLSGFDFDKIHKAMVAVEWKWSNHDAADTHSIPTRDQLVTRARELLEEVARDKGMRRTGGFMAWCYETEKDGGEFERGIQLQIGLAFTFEMAEVDVY